MNHKRAELKGEVKASIREAKPKPAWVTLALIAILMVLQALYMRIDGEWDAMAAMLISLVQTGTYTYVEPAGTASTFGSILCFTLSLMSILLMVGYCLYCLRVSRRAKASFGDLFDSFGFFLRSLWIFILRNFLLFLWALIYAFPVAYMVYTTGQETWYVIGLPLLLPDVIAFYAYRQGVYLMLDNPTMPGVSGEKLAAVKELLEKMCPVEMSDNILGVRWSKLLINAVFSGLGTCVGGTFGDVAKPWRVRRVAVRTMNECIDVGLTSGVRFAPVQGKDITRLFHYRTAAKRAVAFALIPAAMKKHYAIVPPMLQDLEKGKSCEVDAINGVVCAWGRRCGVPTPFNDRIAEIIRKEQAGALRWRPENMRLFDELF